MPEARSTLPSAVQHTSTPVGPEKGGSRNWGRTLGYVLAASVVLLLLAIWRSPSGPSPATPAVRDNSNLQTAASRSPTVHRVGEDFSVGYWSYRCEGAQWEPMIASLGEAERPDAEFLVVDLYVRNNDRTASTLQPLKLIDAQGREYDESSKGTFMPRAFDMLKQLNPGVSSRGYAVFDAPPGRYLLRVSGGFESSEDALIDLSAPASGGRATTDQSSSDPTHSASVQAGAAESVPANTVERDGATPDNSPTVPFREDYDATNSSSLRLLQIAGGTRLFIHVISISHQADGNFTFTGALLQPIALAGGGSLDQRTKLAGSGTTDGKRVTVRVTGLNVDGRDYALQAGQVERTGTAGSGPAVEIESDKVLEMFLASASVYEETSSLGDVPSN